MKRWTVGKICGFMCAVLTAGALTGCGGEYAGMPGNGPVSGGAVSGTAVSGTAVTVKKENRAQKKHRFCNDTHLYYLVYEYPTTDEGEETKTLVERSLADGTEHKYLLPEQFDTLCCVDNDWVYYMNQEKEDEAYVGRFYRAPVEEKAEGKQVNLEKAELFLEEKNEIYGVTYCDGRAIIYLTANTTAEKYESATYELRKFDIQKKEYINVGEADEIIEFLGSETGSWRYIVDEENVFYLDYTSKKDSKDSRECVWQCCRKDGKRKKLLDVKRIEERLEEEKKADLYPGGAELKITGIFKRKNRLYCQVSVRWEKEKVVYQNAVILSQDIGGDGEPEIEEELSRCLVNPEKNRKAIHKYWASADLYWPGYAYDSEALFLSRGQCIEMTEEYAFFALYDPEQKEAGFACFDFESGNCEFLSKSDDEWYLPYRDKVIHPFENSYGWINAIPGEGEEEDWEGD